MCAGITDDAAVNKHGIPCIYNNKENTIIRIRSKSYVNRKILTA